MNAGALGNQVSSTRPMIAVLYRLLRRRTGLSLRHMRLVLQTAEAHREAGQQRQLPHMPL